MSSKGFYLYIKRPEGGWLKYRNTINLSGSSYSFERLPHYLLGLCIVLGFKENTLFLVSHTGGEGPRWLFSFDGDKVIPIDYSLSPNIGTMDMSLLESLADVSGGSGKLTDFLRDLGGR